MDIFDPAQLPLWVAAINTIGVIIVLGFAVRAFLKRDLITKAELTERVAEKDEERKRAEADRDAWRRAAEQGDENEQRLIAEFRSALDALKEKV